MKERITSYVGLDIHKDTIAIAVAEAGRTAPRFIGTTAAELAQLCKALRRSESADIRMIHRRSHCPARRVARSVPTQSIPAPDVRDPARHLRTSA